MYASYPGGPPPRTNALSAIAHTGRPSPLARRPAAGAVPRAQGPGAGSRPGPRPMSAQRITAVTATNARTRRAADQVVHYTREEVFRMNSDARLRRRMEAMPYARYNVHNTDKADRTPVVDIYDNPTGQERYAVGQLWVYASTINDKFGTRRYWVYNTQTNVLVSFEPERGIAADKRGYMSEKASFQNNAAGLGVLGHYGEIGTYGVAAGILTFGAIYEGGVAYALGTAVRTYLVDASKKAVIRMGIDFGTQFTAGTLSRDGSLGQRTWNSLLDVNWLSVGAAGLVNTEGAKWYAKLLASFGSAVVTNGATAKFNNPSFVHVLNLHDQKQRKEFVTGVITGVAFDQVKEYAAPWLGRLFDDGGDNVLGRFQALKYHRVVRQAPKVVDETLVDFLSYEIGTTLETIKKLMESSPPATPPSVQRNPMPPAHHPSTAHK